jgi:hypothetical protein
VLPGVMGMEAFAEAARVLVPDWYVVALDDVDFLAPVKFYRDRPRTLTLTAQTRPDGDELVAECRLVGERDLPGSDAPQRTVHFTGSVRLARHPSPVVRGEPPAVAGHGPVVSPEDVYRLYFHGPAFRVVREAWREDGASAGLLAADLPVDHEPSTAASVLLRMQGYRTVALPGPLDETVRAPLRDAMT